MSTNVWMLTIFGWNNGKVSKHVGLIENVVTTSNQNKIKQIKKNGKLTTLTYVENL